MSSSMIDKYIDTRVCNSEFLPLMLHLVQLGTVILGVWFINLKKLTTHLFRFSNSLHWTNIRLAFSTFYYQSHPIGSWYRYDFIFSSTDRVRLITLQMHTNLATIETNWSHAAPWSASLLLTESLTLLASQKQTLKNLRLLTKFWRTLLIFPLRKSGLNFKIRTHSQNLNRCLSQPWSWQKIRNNNYDNSFLDYLRQRALGAISLNFTILYYSSLWSRTRLMKFSSSLSFCKIRIFWIEKNNWTLGIF